MRHDLCTWSLYYLRAAFILGWLSVGIGASLVHAEESNPVHSYDQQPSVEPEPAADPAALDQQPPAADADLEEAKSLMAQGELLEAKDILKSIITREDETADSGLIQSAQTELGSVNMKLLFSPTETDDSFLYTIKPGDNLYNIAKANHTTIDLLKKSNELKSDTIYPGKKLKVSKAQFSISIDKSENTLTLLADGEPFKVYSVSTGENNSTPVGEFTITVKLENPTWYKAGAVVPPDSPDNILGTRWLGFSLKSYGIHGTTAPEDIGKQVSSGCIRMLNQDVEELYTIVPAGTAVTVQD